MCDKFNRTAASAVSFCYRRRNFAYPCHLNLPYRYVSVSPRPPKFSNLSRQLNFIVPAASTPARSRNSAA
ncbi:hypothetical protein CAMGR0001_1301 [Campylobacter gracilis RM3268]|uniref:Uncharacterized protein n=1 Tax=Campylobacter gracilis RM3268 TaxID=553220 RepID=C8PJA2_9BACT|nr:hypothetical protein CAMGR0001_1301 [Campylobacter gracilis RM3268]